MELNMTNVFNFSEPRRFRFMNEPNFMLASELGESMFVL